MYKNTTASLLLLIGTLFWGMTFVFIKEGISLINMFSFLTWRFFIAALVLIVIFINRFSQIDTRLLKYGVLLGIVLSMGYITQTEGLKCTSASKAAFITGLSVVFVPIFLSIINKKLPTLNNIVAVILASIGLSILTISVPLNINPGDVWVFLCAICFAGYIILVGRYAKYFESIPFTVIQLLTVGIITGAVSIFNGTLTVPTGFVVWKAILFCSLFATSFMYAIQNQFQKFISEIKAAIIFSFEPLFAAITAYFYLNEAITIRVIIGGLLIFLGMIFSELKMNQRQS